jgi:hypothetical protein
LASNNASTVYVVSSKNSQQEIEKLIGSLTTHDFLQNLKVCPVSYEQYEKTGHFSRLVKKELTVYKLVKSGQLKTDTSFVKPGENEFAVLLSPCSRCEERDILHELGHIQSSKTKLGTELREACILEEDPVSWFPGPWDYTCSLIGKAVFLPEDVWIERKILDSQDNTAKCAYLEFVHGEYCKGISFVTEGDFAESQSKRVQSGIMRLFNSVASRAFGELAREYELFEVERRFLGLSRQFAASSDLSGIPMHELWDLTREASLEKWVHETLAALKQIVKRRL